MSIYLHVDQNLERGLDPDYKQKFDTYIKAKKVKSDKNLADLIGQKVRVPHYNDINKNPNLSTGLLLKSMWHRKKNV